VINNESKLFKDDDGNMLSLNDLFTTIYSNSKRKNIEITNTIQDISDGIKSPEDMVVMGPLVRDLFEIGIRNDDQMTRLAAVVQKYVSTSERVKAKEIDNKGGFLLSDEERRQLQEIAKENQAELISIQNTNPSNEDIYKLAESKINKLEELNPDYEL
jgi:hypothetical protein